MATDNKSMEMTGSLPEDVGLAVSDTQTETQDLRVILLQELSTGLQKRVENASTIISMFHTSETKWDQQFIMRFKESLDASGRNLDELFSPFTDDADARNDLLKDTYKQAGIAVYNADSLSKIDTLFQFLCLKEEWAPSIIASVQKLIAIQIALYLKEEAEKVQALKQLEEDETQLKGIQEDFSKVDIPVLNEAGLSGVTPISELPAPDKQSVSLDDFYASLEMADFLRGQAGHSDDDSQRNVEDESHDAMLQDLKPRHPEKPGMLRQAVSAAVNSPTVMIVGGVGLVLIASNVAMPIVAAAIVAVVAAALIAYGLYLAIQACRTYRNSKAVGENTPLVAGSSSDSRGQYASIVGEEYERSDADDGLIHDKIGGGQNGTTDSATESELSLFI
ncbi:MAG: hypothetical protein NXI01_05250 [Gammaproteobacteria bacterium]|nr:hypothetical protein [Gammaproteobacteria bacterium]